MNTPLRKDNVQPLMRNDGLEERLNSLFPRWLTDFFEQDFALWKAVSKVIILSEARTEINIKCKLMLPDMTRTI